MNIIAVVPSKILRKWDAIAARQLASEVLALADQVEKMEGRLNDTWRMLENERDINHELSDLFGSKISMTIDGNISREWDLQAQQPNESGAEH